MSSWVRAHSTFPPRKKGKVMRFLIIARYYKETEDGIEDCCQLFTTDAEDVPACRIKADNLECLIGSNGGKGIQTQLHPDEALLLQPSRLGHIKFMTHVDRRPGGESKFSPALPFAYIPNLVICQECDCMFSSPVELPSGQLLPCGHRSQGTLTLGSEIKNLIAKSLFDAGL